MACQNITKIIFLFVCLGFNSGVITLNAMNMDGFFYSLNGMIVYITIIYYIAMLIKCFPKSVDGTNNENNDKTNAIEETLEEIVPEPCFVRDDLFKLIFIFNSGIAALTFYVLYAESKAFDTSSTTDKIIFIIERINFPLLFIDYCIIKKYQEGFFNKIAVLISSVVLLSLLSTISMFLIYGINNTPLEEASRMNYSYVIAIFCSGYGIYAIMNTLSPLKMRQTFLGAVTEKLIQISGESKGNKETTDKTIHKVDSAPNDNKVSKQVSEK
jgi:hypothetical protein